LLRSLQLQRQELQMFLQMSQLLLLLLLLLLLRVVVSSLS
jgi:hypothetical protein